MKIALSGGHGPSLLEGHLVLPGLLLYTLVNGVLRRKYPKEEILEWRKDAHAPYAVHEV